MATDVSYTDVNHILQVIRVILKEEKRYCAIPRYGETVQKNNCMSVWRLQLITWLMEVSIFFGKGIIFEDHQKYSYVHHHFL